MRNYIEMDSTPLGEKCINVGNSIEMQELEVKVMIDMIIGCFDPFPEGFYLKRNRNYHEFGMYYDIKLCYEEGDGETESHSEEFTFYLKSNWPEQRDEEARGCLESKGYFNYLKNQPMAPINQFV